MKTNKKTKRSKNVKMYNNIKKQIPEGVRSYDGGMYICDGMVLMPDGSIVNE